MAKTKHPPRGKARPRAAGPPRDTYHHGNLRPALIAAALRILQQQGVAALTLRAAARTAGVSQAAPYRHFADKEALLAAVAEEGFRTLGAAVEAAVAAAGSDFIARFRAQGATYVRFAVEHPSEFRLMFGGELHDFAKHLGLQAAANGVYRRLVDAVEEGQRLGLVRAGDVKDQATAAWAMVHGLSSLLVDGQLSPGSEPLDAFAFRALQYLFVGFRHESVRL